MIDFQEQLRHTRKYAEAFWKHEMIDRPYVCVTAPTDVSSYSVSQAECFEVCMSENYDKILTPFMEHIQKTYYAGEALPSLNITCGPDQYAGFFSGEIKSAIDTGTTWLAPCIEDWSDFVPVIDKSENGYFNKLKKFYEYAAIVGKDKFLPEMLDMHSNMDALSALRGAVDLCMDIYDCPEEVIRVLNGVADTYDDVFHMVYEAGNMKETGTIGWSPIYCAGKSAVLQCDYSCLVSPEHGREFVFPAIEKEIESLDHCIYHLDGKEALVHLDTILSIDRIDCIQWVPGAGQPRTLEWMDLLKKIQAAGKSLWIYDWTVEEIKAYHKELQPDKVAYTLDVNTPSEADELLEYLTKNT